MSGNTGLTEEFIYTKLATKGDLYEVLSSATTGAAKMGYIPMCVLDTGRPLKVFGAKPGILVARNGKAGQMTYLKTGRYTINDHAYVLSLSDDFKKENHIDTLDSENNFLLWFIFTYQLIIYDFASKSANATWNKSDFFKTTIDIPGHEEIDEIARLYEDSLQVMNRAQQVINRLSDLLRKQVSMSSE